MKVYGETIFDIIYLLLAAIIGIYILINSKNKLGKLMGFATIILGFGDAFHLVPRILSYFIDKDFTLYLGVGKLITSITMTIFYIFMYYILEENYHLKNSKNKMIVWLFAIFRIILCLLPHNRWLTNNGSLLMGIIRNIPFTILGLLVIIWFYQNRKKDKIFKNIWFYITLSFIFYIPVVVGASSIPLLGMMMLPKTICYVIIILTFRKKVMSERNTK